MPYKEHFETKRCATDALQGILWNKEVCYWCLTRNTLEERGVLLMPYQEYFGTKRCATGALQGTLWNKEVCYRCLTRTTV